MAEQEKNSSLPELEVFVPEKKVIICLYCKQPIETEYIEIKKGKFAHKECAEQNPNNEEKLLNYICHLYELEYVPPRVKRQLTQYKKEFGYTDTGMAKTLEFMYEIKHLQINKIAFNTYGLGLLKSYYDQAHDYYYAIWEAQQSQQKTLTERPEDLLIRQVEVTIPSPKRKEKKKRRLFSFLDKE